MCRTGCLTQDHESWCPSAGLEQRAAYYRDLFFRGLWRCSDCNAEAPLSEFYIRKRGKGAGKPTTGKCRIHVMAVDTRTNWQYNIDYEAMLARQGGRCALCGTTSAGGKGKFHVDHDHNCCAGKRSCGKCVRGLLCVRCNSGIGYFDDDPELMRKAIEYVSR